MNKNTEISERISKVIDFVNVSKNDFAKALKYKRSQSIYDITNGKSKPSFDFFFRFLNSEYSEKINVEWLIAEIGSMEKSNEGSLQRKANPDEIIELQRKIIALQEENAKLKEENIKLKVALGNNATGISGQKSA